MNTKNSMTEEEKIVLNLYNTISAIPTSFIRDRDILNKICLRMSEMETFLENRGFNLLY
jgi:hypothetical protein